MNTIDGKTLGKKGFLLRGFICTTSYGDFYVEWWCDLFGQTHDPLHCTFGYLYWKLLKKGFCFKCSSVKWFRWNLLCLVYCTGKKGSFQWSTLSYVNLLVWIFFTCFIKGSRWVIIFYTRICILSCQNPHGLFLCMWIFSTHFKSFKSFQVCDELYTHFLGLP